MTAYTGFDVAFRSTSLETAISLDISSIFSSSTGGTGNQFALMFDALLTTDVREKKTLANGFSYLRCLGTGLRVAILLRSMTASLKLSVAAVAAQTKLGLATASFKVEGIGVDDTVLADILSLPVTGSFDEKTYKLLRTAIATTLPTYLLRDDVGTGQYSIPLPMVRNDPSSISRGLYYAASMVGQRAKISVALARRPTGVSSEAVMVGYARFAGNADPASDPQPTTEQAERASRWIATGSVQA